MSETMTAPVSTGPEPVLRVLVVDDEPTARQRIVRLLHTMAGVRVIGECGSGREALQAIPSLTPDVVFLDIAMPGLDGLGLARRLAAAHGPLVVFVTAYDEHALEAFRIHATDFVMKPVDRGRLLDALEHARVTVRRARLERDGPASNGASPGNGLSMARFAVRDGNRTHIVLVSDILWVESYGNYARVFTPASKYIHRSTMAKIAEELAPHGFMRIHRTVIANAARIVQLERRGRGQYSALLDTGVRLPVSRTFRFELHARWGLQS
ncbi:MAG TPA: LytTR family DNA-binding domain-containing protein [Gemmatimonadaceae bacterium]|nr:LytTR family DNA-binding domain-containing protein [Gemmatimonadaceae bacterium]